MTDVTVKVIKRETTIGPPRATSVVKAVLRGPQGRPGETLVGEGAHIFRGDGAPVGDLGKVPPPGNGEWYIDSLTADMYQLQADVWVLILNIRGLQGPQGPAGQDGQLLVGGGANILTGDGTPDNGLGVDGDLYIENDNDDVFKKVSGVWVFQTNIKGAAGAQGLQGQQGNPGTNGTNGWSPIVAVVVDGSREVLQVVDWTGGTGTKPGTGKYIGATGLVTLIADGVNVKGDQGPQGNQGIQGVPGVDGAVWRSGSGAPSNGLGINGDFYLNTANGDVYQKASGTYSVVTNIKGPAGADGAVWRSGSGAPSNGLGVNGDFYLNTANGDVYQKASGTYSVVTNIVGPQGNQGTAGTNGTDGATWRTGSGAPSNSLGVNGDLYFRTDTSDVYLKSSGTYSVVANIKGSTGNTGATGAAGASSIEFVIDGGGSAITTGLKGFLRVPFGGTFTKNSLFADQSGSIVVNVWKCTFAQFDAGATHPVAGDKITASAPPTISSATKSEDSTLTGWTTSFSAGDVLGFNVDSVSTITRVTLALDCNRT